MSTAGSNTYQYDANGNLTQRVEGGATYTQAWDAENRLISVTSNGQTTQFVYDGDGVRVRQQHPDTSNTYYVGGVEVKLSGTLRITRTYYAANSLMAMRVVTSTGGNTLYFLHSDHLGSASLTTNMADWLLLAIGQ